MSGRGMVVVVTSRDDLPELPGVRVVSADRYLSGGEPPGGLTVINLCRSYRYRTKGYYVSLLGDARGHAVLPSVETVEGLSEPFALYRVLREAGVPTIDVVEMRSRRRTLPAAITPEADVAGAPASPLLRIAAGEAVAYRPAATSEVIEALVYFGSCADPRFRTAAQAIYREWPTPVLRIQMVRHEREWKVAHAAPVTLAQLEGDELDPLLEVLADPRRLRRRGSPSPRELKRASIAVLYDPADPFAPSSPETLDRLERAAARRNVYVHRIGPEEIRRLSEYDALFIRSLTGVREPSFPFALRAEMLDMPVIDDPQSIIRCGNKVFLEELLRREGIPTPRTVVATARTPWRELEALGMPLVIKLPDGSFSSAVHRCADAAEYRAIASEMFRTSPLIIVQEYLPTDYDWRVTVLGGRVLFAARYHMARGHWQIRSDGEGGERYGKVEAVPRDRAPGEIVDLALRAAGLIGNGLYGVDLKETERGPVVIEINDNPNLDAGYDDAADGSAIYDDIIDFFLQRIEEAPGRESEPEPASPSRSSARVRTPRPAARRHYRPFEVAGMELEYAVVDEALEPVSRVEEALRALAGRPVSDVELGGVGFSNEIADHVFEVKTTEPSPSLREAETVLVEGVQRFDALLRDRFGARLLPTGMHPWLDPRERRLWTRSSSRIYGTYARVFDVQTHGWLNVQASHLNLPLGRERDAVAMHNAASLLVPYLPALAASTPIHDGVLQDAVDARLAWILRHQARVPESQGAIVPEPVESFSDYRRRILAPMYEALDRLPDAGALRHEFFNARGAVFKFSRRALEIRVLDMQECVRMDVAIAAFIRAALRRLAGRIMRGRLALPPHEILVADFHATIAEGSRARVLAPYLGDAVPRDERGTSSAREVLRALLSEARRGVRRDEAAYLDLVERTIEAGSLSERIREALRPAAGDPVALRERSERVYRELADCLVANEPWAGRWG